VILERTFLAIVAASAVAAATATAVVAAAFALFLALQDPLGAAGAAAVVAAVALIIVGLACAIVAWRAKAYREQHPPEPSLVEKVADLVREKPLVSAGAALAAGLMALKNPQLAATVAAAFLTPKPRDHNRR
jgi:uncharacterized membrane protein HdeD (DUF308 family)